MEEREAFELADRIYSACYDLDSKQHRNIKVAEIVDWLRNGDAADRTFEDLVAEWREYDGIAEETCHYVTSDPRAWGEVNDQQAKTLAEAMAEKLRQYATAENYRVEIMVTPDLYAEGYGDQAVLDALRYEQGKLFDSMNEWAPAVLAAMHVYQYWTHTKSGEIYAVEIRQGRVVAACGPLYYKEIAPDPSDFDFDPEDAEWIEENKEDFALHERDESDAANYDPDWGKRIWA